MAGLEVEGVNGIFTPLDGAFCFKDVADFLDPDLFAEGFGNSFLLVFFGVVGRGFYRRWGNLRHNGLEELIHAK